jgi:CheY-like chemotaxis protein
MAIKNILYAEDNPDDVVILKIALRRAGIRTVLKCVDDGEVAIAWLKGEGVYSDRETYPLPDVLLLDLKMPKKSGFDVLGWLRSSGNFNHLPAIVLSSSDDPRDLERAGKLGVAKYFRKSAACQELIQYLNSWPDSHA